MSEQQQRDEDLARVKQHAAQLIEYFDSVQIFCTRSAPELDGTVNVTFGRGNWFARYGLAKAWCVKEEEILRTEARKEDTP